MVYVVEYQSPKSDKWKATNEIHTNLKDAKYGQKMFEKEYSPIGWKYRVAKYIRESE